MKTDVDIRKDLYEELVVVGSITNLPGLQERFFREVADLAPASIRVGGTVAPQGQFAFWRGMSTASVESSQAFKWVLKDQ